ncbi:unnamed protein product [Pseudo-nitzschia multistriata]|uniref:Uncharacterized protein n=1 Tax=Pseudo-nitzschia multistriata TaxID=183589 RepID=A0A448Z6N8_9STRA|nr:unnamed protein product [Pseudo-nitzschia multistriata]
MTLTKAILSRGPGFPASNVPRVPDKAQAVTLQAKVPRGKLGRHELNFIILHRASTPSGEKSRLSASRRSSVFLKKTKIYTETCWPNL